MAARPRDGETTHAVAPRDRRLPLSYIEFREPQSVDGLRVPVRYVAAGEAHPGSDNQVAPLSLFLDPELRLVHAGEDCYPLEAVKRFRRAKAARGK
jgi:hypothetical protein